MGDIYIEGIIGVRAAIEGGRRQVREVLVDVGKYKKRDRRTVGFVSFLRAVGASIRFCEREEIDAMASGYEGGGRSHGGVIAVASERRYEDIDEVLDGIASGGYGIFLDGVEDPFNLGYSYRALYASGVSGVILPLRDRTQGDCVTIRSSAGASERVPTALIDISTPESRAELVKKIHSRGITLCCAAVTSVSESLFTAKIQEPLILFIGGEKRGISPEFLENADRVFHVPYANPEARYSLPTATVAALAGFRFSMRDGTQENQNDFSEA